VPLVAAHPRFAGHAAGVLAAWLDGPREVAVIVPPASARASDGTTTQLTTSGAAGTEALVRAARTATAPGAVVVVGEPGSTHPLLADRPLVEGRATAYVCRHFVCDAPTTDPPTLARTLGRADPH